MLQHRTEKGSARNLLALDFREGGRFIAQLFREFLRFDVDIDARADDDVVDALHLGTHLGQDAHELLAAREHVIRPLDADLHAKVLSRLRDRDGGQQRALRCILRQEVRAQDDGEPDALAGRREEGALEASAPLALLLSDDDEAIRSALLRQPLCLKIRRIDGRVEADLRADAPRMEAILDFLWAQRVRRTLQGIPAARVTDDIVTVAPQLLDVLPDSRARDAQALRHLLTRKIRIACFSEQS